MHTTNGLSVSTKSYTGRRVTHLKILPSANFEGSVRMDEDPATDFTFGEMACACGSAGVEKAETESGNAWE